MKKQSKSLTLASKVIFAAFEILKEHVGELNGREVVNQVDKRVDLDEWAKSKYEKSGYIRWQSVLQFFSIDCVKVGFLIKKKGT
jgi:restriction system protein